MTLLDIETASVGFAKMQALYNELAFCTMESERCGKTLRQFISLASRAINLASHLCDMHRSDAAKLVAFALENSEK